MITVILYNSGLELLSTLPKEIVRHPSIQNDVKKRKKQIHKIMLDLAIHQPALPSKMKKNRGRPDIVHQCLLQYLFARKIIETSSNIDNKRFSFIIHTVNDEYFSAPVSWRIPVHYLRFRGLMETLFDKKKLKVNDNGTIYLKKGNLLTILDEINYEKKFILFTSHGKEKNSKKLSDYFQTLLDSDQNCIVLVGGYQHGSIPSNYKSQLLKLGHIEEIALSGGRLPSWKVINDLMVLLGYN